MNRRGMMAGMAAGLAGIARPGRAQTPVVIKFSHVVAEDTPKGKGALKFKELAEKYTQGRVKVEVYPNSQLFKDKEEIEALQLGAVHLLAPSTAKFAPLGAKEFEAMDLPFIFPSAQVWQKVATGPVGQWLFGKLEPKGVKGLGYWNNGFYIASANRPLYTPADYKGLKIRISGSKIADQMYRGLGAIPQILAFSELYQALQTGVVDGCENSASNYWTQKLHEVQSHITLSNHANLSYALITNLKFWNGLAPDLRGPLDQAVKEANDYTNQIGEKENADALASIRAAGKAKVIELTDAQAKAWRDAMLPIHKWAEGRVGKEIVGMMYKESGMAQS